MLKRIKIWHSGLSTLGRVVVWSIAVIFAGTAIAAASSNVNKEPPSTQKPKPVSITTKKTVIETADVAFTKTTINDGNLEKGKTEIRTVGVNGVKTYTYNVTYQNGIEISKELVKEEVTTPPVTEVTAIGTYVVPKPACDPNYSGGCVPIASDVDCGGGSGNGPAYFYGTATVVGYDIYGLDRDGDGIACE